MGGNQAGVAWVPTAGAGVPGASEAQVSVAGADVAGGGTDGRRSGSDLADLGVAALVEPVSYLGRAGQTAGDAMVLCATIELLVYQEFHHVQRGGGTQEDGRLGGTQFQEGRQPGHLVHNWFWLGRRGTGERGGSPGNVVLIDFYRACQREGAGGGGALEAEEIILSVVYFAGGTWDVVALQMCLLLFSMDAEGPNVVNLTR
ncbi:hypothetical protein HDU80_010398 [Chytriomyces hyalinus]|nr:hypothetical protein HDU80_010398 [Chytriomyces hyalinus]